MHPRAICRMLLRQAVRCALVLALAKAGSSMLASTAATTPSLWSAGVPAEAIPPVPPEMAETLKAKPELEIVAAPFPIAGRRDAAIDVTVAVSAYAPMRATRAVIEVDTVASAYDALIKTPELRRLSDILQSGKRALPKARTRYQATLDVTQHRGKDAVTEAAKDKLRLRRDPACTIHR